MVGLSHIAKASQTGSASVSPECLVIILQNFAVKTARINSRFALVNLIILTHDFSFVTPWRASVELKAICLQKPVLGAGGT